MIMKVKGLRPKVAPSAFVHKSAVVTGDVRLAEHVSIWPCAVLRGDANRILIGENTNIQDNSVLHTTEVLPLVIAENVVVGHNVNLHSCEIGEGSLIGIGAVVLDGAKIGKNSVVAAGALVPPGKEYPDGVVLMGSPAKVAREIRAEELENQRMLVAYYKKEAEEYRQTEQEL